MFAHPYFGLKWSVILFLLYFVTLLGSLAVLFSHLQNSETNMKKS